MDRDSLIEYLRKYYNGTLSHREVSNILYDYCTERGKKAADTYCFITLLMQYNMFHRYLDYALSWYKNKYKICTLSTSNNQIIQIF